MKILIIRFSSIGDIILTTPIIESLKIKYKNCEIDFVVFNHLKEAITGNIYLDNIITFDKAKYKGKSGIESFKDEKLQNNYDLIIDLHSKIRSKYLVKLLKGKKYKYNKRKLYKTILVKLRLIKYHVDNTIINRYYTALEKLNITRKSEKLRFDGLVKPNFFDLLAQNYVVFAPGASKNTKCWPIDYFSKLGRLLNEEIIILGSKGEAEKFNEIQNKIGKNCINLSGKLSLKESGYIISKSKYVVANDSSVFHIARALQTKVFVIFGPTDSNMFDYSRNEVLITFDVNCRPCSLHGDKKCPKGHFKCMKLISPEIVQNKIMENIDN